MSHSTGSNESIVARGLKRFSDGEYLGCRSIIWDRNLIVNVMYPLITPCYMQARNKRDGASSLLYWSEGISPLSLRRNDFRQWFRHLLRARREG